MTIAMFNLFCSIWMLLWGIYLDTGWIRCVDFWMSGLSFGVFAFCFVGSLVK